MALSMGCGISRGATSWLALAAAPSFALMALISALDPSPLTLCAAARSALPVDGMTAMYLLMSIFHLPAWLQWLGPTVTGGR